MPKLQNPKLAIHLDLLKPQSAPEKILVKLFRWLPKTGRYIFIFVEAIVLIAFVSRFKLDADLASKKEAIEQQIPYIESLKPFEILIKDTQLKLATIDSVYKTSPDYEQILKRIAGQTPAGVRIINLTMKKDVAKVMIHLNAQAQNNSDLATLLGGLKQDQSFSEVEITSISFDKGSLNFSLAAQAKSGGISL